MRQNKKNEIIGIIITLIILFLLIYLTNIENNNSKYISKIFKKISQPVSFFIDKYKHNYVNIEDVSNVKELEEKYKNLQKENSDLKQKLNELDILKSENKSLSELLNLKERYKNIDSVTAKVISYSNNNYEKIVTINVGMNDGVKKNSIVIANGGLYGKIIEAEENTSKVELITNVASKIAVKVGKKENSIIAQGTIDIGDKLVAIYIPNNYTLVSGEPVYTSGVGGIFQKDIFVGYIDQVVFSNNAMDNKAYIIPNVNFKNVTDVLVIK